MKFRKYQKGDLYSVIDKLTVPEPDDITLSWTATSNDGITVLGCGGFRRHWKGVYEAWMAFPNRRIIKNNKITIIRFTRKLINVLGAHRIQASVLRDSEPDARYVMFLGFKREGTMFKYSPDQQDYDLYALVK